MCTHLVAEHIVFSCHVLKYNRFGMRQERNLLLTTTQLANVKGHGKHNVTNCQSSSGG